MKVTASLKEWGFNVVSVPQGATDENIARLARRSKRILLTFDADFANILIYPPQEFFGIVRINIQPQFLNTVIEALKNLFVTFNSQRSFRGKLIILEPAGFRVWGERI